MYLAWLLLKPASSLHNKHKSDTVYSQQVIVCFTQLAIVKLFVGTSQSQKSDVFEWCGVNAGSMRLKSQASRILLLLTNPLHCLLSTREVAPYSVQIDRSQCVSRG